MATVFIVTLIVAYAVLVLGIAVSIILDIRRAPLGRRGDEVMGCKLGPDSCGELKDVIVNPVVPLPPPSVIRNPLKRRESGLRVQKLDPATSASLMVCDFIAADAYLFTDQQRWAEAQYQVSCFVQKLSLVYRRPHWFSLDWLVLKFEQDILLDIETARAVRELHRAALISVARYRSIGTRDRGFAIYLAFDDVMGRGDSPAAASSGLKPPPPPPTRARPEAVEAI